MATGVTISIEGAVVGAAFEMGYSSRCLAIDGLDAALTRLVRTIPESIQREVRRRIELIEQSWKDHEAYIRELRQRSTFPNLPSYPGPSSDVLTGLIIVVDQAFDVEPLVSVYRLGSILAGWINDWNGTVDGLTPSTKVVNGIRIIPAQILTQSATLLQLAENGGASRVLDQILEKTRPISKSAKEGSDERVRFARFNLGSAIVAELNRVRVFQFQDARSTSSLRNDESVEPSNQFRRSGNGWTLQFKGSEAFALVDLKGLDYVHFLLERTPRNC